MSDRRIKITYTKHSPPEEGEDSDPDGESGWEDEEGVSMEPDEPDEPDEVDLEEGLTAVDKAVSFLKGEYASEPSSSGFHGGIWYSTGYEDNYRTGESTERSFHLYGFTLDEELGIYCAMNPKDKHAAHQMRVRAIAQVATAPHGRCEPLTYCVPHREDKRVPSCKSKRNKGRR